MTCAHRTLHMQARHLVPSADLLLLWQGLQAAAASCSPTCRAHCSSQSGPLCQRGRQCACSFLRSWPDCPTPCSAGMLEPCSSLQADRSGGCQPHPRGSLAARAVPFRSRGGLDCRRGFFLGFGPAFGRLRLALRRLRPMAQPWRARGLSRKKAFALPHGLSRRLFSTLKLHCRLLRIS